ncbi:FMP32 protein [Nymphaea thermarum]|nr:FMP32 protein [Nymphaea thermarum]
MAGVVAARRVMQRALTATTLVNCSIGRPRPGLETRGIWQHVNSKGKRGFLVDTLALVRTLEEQGVPSKQAEAITAVITEVLNGSLENVAQSCVSIGDMQKENRLSLLQHEIEKVRSDIEKGRSELRHEIDKVTAGQRLDLNLERGRTRDELANQHTETANLNNKLDREIHVLRARLEAAKYDLIKYCVGTLVSISAVGLAVARILI